MVLLDGVVEIYARGTNVSIPLIDSKKIDEISEAIKTYQEIVRERLSPIVK